MQLLTFTVTNRRYGIDTRQIVEVLPLIASRPLPRQPQEIRGLIRYRGRFLPSIDLGQLLDGTGCRDRLGTRTVIVRLTDASQSSPLIGLVAEDVIGIAAAKYCPATTSGTGFLGPLIDLDTDADDTAAQLIAVDRILPPDALEELLRLANQTVSSDGTAAETTA